MSCCRNPAIACILARVADFPAAKPLTPCLMASDESIRPPVRFAYQLPMPSHVANSFFWVLPPAGKNDTTNWPARPSHGGISGSCLIPVTSLTVHEDTLPPRSVGL